MSRMTSIFFDLDGTLIDPIDGFAASINHTLAEAGHPAMNVEELRRFIGPPIHGTLAKMLGTDDQEEISRAVAIYRAHYTAEGMHQLVVYPGVHNMLGELHRNGYALFVATSKITRIAQPIIEAIGLDCYFSEVYGSDPNASRDDKGYLLGQILSERNLPPEECWMVGDRRFDMEAAKQNGMGALGVSYGYGSVDELRSSGADAICAFPAEVRDWALGAAGLPGAARRIGESTP